MTPYLVFTAALFLGFGATADTLIRKLLPELYYWWTHRPVAEPVIKLKRGWQSRRQEIV